MAVLLAERDPYTAELQEHFLRTEGFDVEVVLNGEAALGALTVRPPAVAIIELLISGGTGLDLCRSFKRHGVPVIAASVLRSRDQALEAGADAFLAKPLDPAQLASAIRELLSMSAATAARAGSRVMTDRMLSGHEPLDTVLGGGLPANAISLIMGLPGAGKTIIAQQYVFRNGSPGRPAVYFSTVSEPLDKIVRFGQSLDFFDHAAIGTSVLYEDLGATVTSQGLAGVARQIGAVLRSASRGWW